MMMPACVPMAGTGRRNRSRDVRGTLWALCHLFLLLLSIGGTCSECLENLTDNAGTITSPSYPNNYPNNISCSWLIHVVETSTVELTFVDFDLENEVTCSYDFVQVRQNDANGANVTARLCGNAGKNLTLRSATSLWVFFSSDSIVNQFSGFKALFRRIEKINSSLRLVGGKTSSQGKLQYYTGYNWVHVCGNGFNNQAASVVCKELGMSPLNATYLVREISSSVADNRWYQCTGSEDRLAQCQSGQRPCTLHDVSITCRTQCGANFSEAQGSITTVNYPNANYYNNMDCEWTIVASAYATIELFFIDMSIENSSDCYFDFLEVREKNATGRLLARLCGEATPNAIVSNSSLNLRFHSDTFTTARGFLITYTISAPTSVCGGNLVQSQGNFTSPNYPFIYPTNVDCEWTITVTSGFTVELTFLHMAVELNPSCAYDYIEVRITDKSGPPIDRLCGSHLPAPIVANMSLYVHFHSDSSSMDRGFKASYAIYVSGMPDNQADTVRLVHGATNNYGRLERWVARTWTPVCGNDFDIDDATVVCRELGLAYSELTVSASGSSAADNRWYQCRGSEDRLAQCVTLGKTCTLNNVEIMCSETLLIPIKMTINVDVDTSANSLPLQLQYKLSAYLVKKHNGVLAVNVKSVRRGSVIVDAVVTINQDIRLDAVNSLISDLKDLLDIPMQVNLVYGKSQFEVEGLLMTKDTAACEVVTRLNICRLQSQQCVESGGRASCRSNDKSVSNWGPELQVPVSCALGGLVLVIVIACVIGWRRRKKRAASLRPEIIPTISSRKLTDAEQESTDKEAEFVFDHIGFTARDEPPVGSAEEVYTRPEPSAPPVHEDVSPVFFISAAAYSGPAPAPPNILADPSRPQIQAAEDQQVLCARSAKESGLMQHLTQPMSQPVTQPMQTPPAAPVSFQRNFPRFKQPEFERRTSTHPKVVNSTKKRATGMPAPAFCTRTKPDAPASSRLRPSASSGERGNIIQGNDTGSALALYPDLSTFHSSTDSFIYV